MSLALPKLGDLLIETKNRKEVWAWDGVIPAHDLTLVAAFMKKGKTTLLTGLVNGWLKKGFYCGRPAGGVRKVLYLAPEEGDTLIKRFDRMGFAGADEVALTVIPRGHRFWDTLVTCYRMRQWDKFVRDLREEGFDAVVMDGLHTLLQMFEPQAKEDNEGVSRFMTQFVLPFTGKQMTVVAALHTKKGGGDPKVHVPPEEMIRGASAWMAHPGQILILEHLRKEDMKKFAAFGRYEGSTADGWIVKYNKDTGEYESVGVDEPDDVGEVVDPDAQARLVIEQVVMEAGGAGISLTDLCTRVTSRKETIRRVLLKAADRGVLRVEERKREGGGRPALWAVWTVREEEEEVLDGEVVEVAEEA